MLRQIGLASGDHMHHWVEKGNCPDYRQWNISGSPAEGVYPAANQRCVRTEEVPGVTVVCGYKSKRHGFGGPFEFSDIGYIQQPIPQIIHRKRTSQISRRSEIPSHHVDSTFRSQQA